MSYVSMCYSKDLELLGVTSSGSDGLNCID